MDTLNNISVAEGGEAEHSVSFISKIGFSFKKSFFNLKKAFKESLHFSVIRLIAAVLIACGAFAVYNYATELKTHQSILYSVLLGLILPAPLYLSLKGMAKKLINALFFISMPFISFYVVEMLNGNIIWEDLTYIQIVLNLVWYFAVYLILLIMLRRMALAASVSALLFVFVGIVNHYVLTFRGTTIFPCDIITWKTALNVSNNFDFTPDRDIIRAASCFMLQALFAFRCCGMGKIKIKKCFSIPVLAVMAVYVGVFYFTPFLPSIGMYAQQWKTQANGFILNFTTALKYSHMSEPEGYDIETAEKIQSQYLNSSDGISHAVSGTTIRPKNIIAVMNESFDDFSQFEDFTLSEDPAPFFHSLTENTIKGRMYSPVTGGGTANVEYEYLTGNSLSFLGEGVVAYQLYIKENAPNLAQQLGALGYETTAFHPYLASGWNRRNVYTNFGFDNQIYSEDMENQKIVRKYISDSCDYEKIFDITDGSDHPQFIFNVTMQNHSAYDKPWSGQKYHVSPSGGYSVLAHTTTAEQYFSLIRESDDAIKELIEHYQNVDEPTLIVFFGDHQPPLGNKFYTALYKKDLNKRTTSELLKQYTTPFFIWANYDIPEAQDIEISSNFLGLLTVKMANVPLTDYQIFLDDFYSEMPVFSNIAVIDKDGIMTQRDRTDRLTKKQRKLVERYSYLNYYSLFDRDVDKTTGFYYLE